MAILVRLVHSEKAYSPMPVTVSGSVMLARLLQSKNVPMLTVRSFGESVTLSRLLQAVKANSPSSVRLSGRSTSRSPVLEKASSSIDCSPSGSVTLRSCLQLAKVSV